jgi:apolipoprotein N-acyltransferase
MLFHKEHKWFGTGFYVGIFWFWWIGLSFRYYALSWMIPFVDFFIAIFYGFLFYLIGKLFCYIKKFNENAAKIFLVLILTFGFDYLSPFTFDWLKPEILFVNTIFGVEKIVLFLVFFAVAFYKEMKYFSLILLVVALLFKPHMPKIPDLDIYVSHTNIPQDKKWKREYINYEIRNNFNIINKAVKLRKDVVILPESAFPLFLNEHKDLMEKLKNISNEITIVTGGLHLKNNKFYNATYIFENGSVKILDKHVLVPFGEYIPLPFFEKEINELFFGGASDYTTAKKFGIFNIGKYKFINAICYEATIEDLYKLKPSYVIALSNDAWFMPSIMPSLQEMIIKTYALKYSKIVYHSINGFKSYVIK